MKTLVTGSAGFVGHHLIKHLKDCGDEVSGTDRVEGGPDLKNFSDINKLLKKAKPEVIFHLAGQADVALSWKDPIETFRTNVEGTVNLLAAAREAGVEKVLTVTSADIYGSVSATDIPINENTPFKPVSPYAASKAAADTASLQAYIGYGQNVIRARSFNHLGPGQSDRFVSSAIASQIAKNEKTEQEVIKIGNLKAKRDFTDVRDVVKAYRLLAEKGKEGEVYNVCSGVAIPILSIAEKLIKLAKKEMRLEIQKELFRPMEVEILQGDPSLIFRETNWVPEIPLDQTLSDLLNFWRERVLLEAEAQ